MKKISVLILILSYVAILKAQNVFGVKVDLGMSHISNQFEAFNTIINTSYAPSGNIGVFYQRRLTEKNSIIVEVIFSSIHNSENWEIFKIGPNGELLMESTLLKVNKNINYLSIPVYYERQFGNFGVSVGIRTGLVLSSSGRQRFQQEFNGQIQDVDSKHKGLEIKVIDYGINVGLAYLISNRISLSGQYYHGLPNLIGESSPDWVWKTQQITLGIRYSIFN